MFAVLATWLVSPARPAVGQEVDSVLTVDQAVVAMGIEAMIREGGGLAPLGVSDRFRPDVGQLFAFTRINGATRETVVKHLWFHGDDLVAEVRLPVRSVRWRTYSSKRIMPHLTGAWRVEVVTEDGRLLESIPFRVEE